MGRTNWLTETIPYNSHPHPTPPTPPTPFFRTKGYATNNVNLIQRQERHIHIFIPLWYPLQSCTSLTHTEHQYKHECPFHDPNDLNRFISKRYSINWAQNKHGPWLSGHCHCSWVFVKPLFSGHFDQSSQLKLQITLTPGHWLQGPHCCFVYVRVGQNSCGYSDQYLNQFKVKYHVCKHDMFIHYNDVIMGAIASQFTSLASVYSAVWLGADQRKHQSSASLAFVRGIHRRLVNSPHKGPVTRKMFPFDDVIMISSYAEQK